MAVAELEMTTVAKKKAGRPKSQNPRGDGLPVRLAPDVVRMAKVVTPMKGLALSAYLSDILRPVVTRDYAQAQRKLDLQGGVS
jgi:hypothetical protein